MTEVRIPLRPQILAPVVPPYQVQRRTQIDTLFSIFRRSQWPSGLRRGSAAVRLLGLRVRTPPGAWMSVVSVVCVVRKTSLRRPITRPEESYRLWCVIVCDLEISGMRTLKPHSRLQCQYKNKFCIFPPPPNFWCYFGDM